MAILAGCASLEKPQFPDAEDPEISTAIDRRAVPEAIAVCHGYGCGLTHLVSLAADWPRIRALFEPPAASAASERRAVAQAVGLFEQTAGRQLGTWRDRPRSPLSLNDPSQLDCVDESINTSSFLHLLSGQDLLRWHKVGEPARRFAFLMFGVHFTAVLIERQGSTQFAVDSWFHANGAPAEVIELDRWRAGWKPDASRASIERAATP